MDIMNVLYWRESTYVMANPICGNDCQDPLSIFTYIFQYDWNVEYTPQCFVDTNVWDLI